MGMGCEGILDRADERSDCTGLQTDFGGVLQRRLWFIYWRRCRHRVDCFPVLDDGIMKLRSFLSLTTMEDEIDEKPVPDVYDGRVMDEAGYAGMADGRPAEHRWFHARHGPHPYTLFNRYVERRTSNAEYL
jgi:hypothetical protein